MSQTDLHYDTEDADDSGAWLSIGDLMSALLMIFALLLMVTLTQLSSEIQAQKESRILIIQALTEAMATKGINVNVDPKTGDVSINDSMLFDQRESRLKPEGEQFLADFVPEYAAVIFSDPLIRDQVARIVIEGHTSSEGEYLYNMVLSMDRAKNVLARLSSMNFAYKEEFLAKLMPAGRGEIEADQVEVRAEDRKVLFRFQLTSDLTEVVERLGKSANE